MNSDGFVFDQEIIAQAVACQLRIGEIAVPVRYFKEASSASFMQSSVYGLRILWLLGKYMAHKSGLHHSRQFESLDRRYHAATDQEAKAHG
jgi:LPS sulfotransferase NodH